MSIASTNLPSYEIVSLILEDLVRFTKPGIKTIEVDKRAEELIERYGAKSYNKGYLPRWAADPFPSVLCISVNSVIAHGIPSDYELKEGDLVNYDLGIIDSDGNCGDAAISVGVGEISTQNKRLLYYAYQTMMYGVSLLVPGANTETIARLINQYAALRGYKVNRSSAGHAIGKEMHEKPNIYNTNEASHNYAVLAADQVFCVEVPLTYGNDNMGFVDSTGWVKRTKDGKPSAFFEVMVKVTKDGPVILTNHIKDIPSL